MVLMAPERLEMIRTVFLASAVAVICCGSAGCTEDSKSQNVTSTSSSASSATTTTASPPNGTPVTTPTAPVVSTADSAPLPAKNVGYLQRTFGPNLVIQNGSTAPDTSAPMFVWNFFGEKVPASTLATNGDGSITLFGGGYANGQISSASASKENSRKFVGTAFGGGAYFETVFKFDGYQGQSTNPNSLSSGFPAFWAMAIEHLSLSGADRWPDKVASFVHFAEFDFFEYNAEYQQHTDSIYTGSVHDWFGEYNKTCPAPAKKFCQIQNPTASKMRFVDTTFDFSKYHTYGALWVPATDTEDGYLEWYLDGAVIGENVIWKRMANEASLAWPGNYAFAIADLQHMALILGSGTEFPMTIKSVSVWQKTTAGNWVE